jgi:hypothetical protein
LDKDQALLFSWFGVRDAAVLAHVEAQLRGFGMREAAVERALRFIDSGRVPTGPASATPATAAVPMTGRHTAAPNEPLAAERAARHVGIAREVLAAYVKDAMPEEEVLSARVPLRFVLDRLPH